MPVTDAGAPGSVALPVRRLVVGLGRASAQWIADDAYLSHYMNALSMIFPVGEQFFIDAVRAGVQSLPAEARGRWAATVQGFVGQEATHRFVHQRYNDVLQGLGFVNHWQRRMRRHVLRARALRVEDRVAITAAYEHFTAVLAGGMLARDWIRGGDPEVARMWRWHAVEEIEHRCVAFDMYVAIGGTSGRRVAWYLAVGALLIVESGLQTVANLRHAGALWRWRTLGQALRLMFAPRGILRTCAWPLLAYLHPRFHPSRQAAPPEAARWLEDNRDAYSVVGAEVEERLPAGPP